jgi:hypothetical protein
MKLREGNYLDYHGQFVIVLDILRDGCEFGYFTDSVGFYRAYNSTDFPKRIKLTEKILKIYGFTPGEYYDDSYMVQYDETLNEWNFYVKSSGGCRINLTWLNYFDELQNIFYDITKEELKRVD